MHFPPTYHLSYLLITNAHFRHSTTRRAAPRFSRMPRRYWRSSYSRDTFLLHSLPARAPDLPIPLPPTAALPLLRRGGLVRRYERGRFGHRSPITACQHCIFLPPVTTFAIYRDAYPHTRGLLSSDMLGHTATSSPAHCQQVALLYLPTYLPPPSRH